jgi:hypothetical protein
MRMAAAGLAERGIDAMTFNFLYTERGIYRPGERVYAKAIVRRGEPAAPAAEKVYIEKIRGQYYSALGDIAAPLSAANFLAYGASTTPTLALIDRAGVVRYYHPGAASEAELTGQIRSVLK